ncbi:hypothetical protein [Paenibacillus sp. SN-8-1]|uniref:hypothetical protein n=1 Tax=Paenibacillus sp. SN-8-1 TaxID=3435409 RepID=UPI003D9A0EED
MVHESDDTVREFDVVSSTLPIGLKVGDYIDYRLVYPLGEDYIVLSHKRVEELNGKTVKLHLSESEIHQYQAAIVDYYLKMQSGSMVYMAKYVEPGAQKQATSYYAVPKNILAIMAADPNIVEKVNAAINNNTRTIIEHGMSGVSTEQGSAINSGRNDIKSKIDEGQTQATNNAKAKAEEEAQLKQQQQDANNVIGSDNSKPNDSGTKAPLKVEKGVVE